MKIEIDDELYARLQSHVTLCDDYGAGEIDVKDVLDMQSCIAAILKDAIEILPTRDEKKLWREMLHTSLTVIATAHPEFAPRTRDSLYTLLDSFLAWANYCNGGYFDERDDMMTDRYCAWLVQEFDRRY